MNCITVAAVLKMKPSSIPLILFLFPLLLHIASGDNGSLPQRRIRRNPPPTIINPERAQLLKDALGWMTFRKNGELMTDAELQPLFLDALTAKYRSSKFYRTFVIAFQKGILSKLTLNENDGCDPSYTFEYKDPSNDSVTWYYQKQFTFRMYDQRYTGNKFCDYRQGLICNPATNKCQCPDGAVMQPISPNNPVKRCLLQENEICALIDIDHGNDPQHSALSSNLYHLIFNLEKPTSCKMGTQCRFKNTNHNTPLCYDVNSGPWDPPKSSSDIFDWTIKFGEECTLGLYASTGSCEIGKLRLIPGFVCYNFGPPRSSRFSTAQNRTGFCATEWGSHGIASWIIDGKLPVLFIAYVHPRTVPLRGKDLRDYYQWYMKSGGVYATLRNKENEAEQYPERDCSVKKTEEMEVIWRYFASLEEDPPAGQDYVTGATSTELDAKMKAVEDLVSSPGGWCKVYWHYSRGIYGGTHPSLKCVAEGTPDADGNDGKCKKPGNIDDREFRKMAKKRKDAMDAANSEQEREESIYRKEILQDNPEAQCNPSLGSPPETRSHNHGDILEGGYCPDGYLCYKDYNDDRGIYDSQCTLKQDMSLSYSCLETGDGIKYGYCEAVQLDKMISEELERMTEYSRLGIGDACRHDLENGIRELVVGGKSNMNKYKLLSSLEKAKSSGGTAPGEGFCDRTRLLECTQSNICECMKDMEPRKKTINKKDYKSDYCYFVEGDCSRDLINPNPYWPNSDKNPLRLTESEKEKVAAHYAGTHRDCWETNRCVFVDFQVGECTTKDTGKTGYDLIPDPTTTTRAPALKPGNTGGAGWREVGGAGHLEGNKITTGWSLVAIWLWIIILN